MEGKEFAPPSRLRPVWRSQHDTADGVSAHAAAAAGPVIHINTKSCKQKAGGWSHASRAGPVHWCVSHAVTSLLGEETERGG